MKTSLDCIPCFVRQAVAASKMVSMPASERERLIRDILKWIGDINMDQTPPAIAKLLHCQMRKIMGTEDHYRAAKDHHNRLAKALIPILQPQIDASNDPLMVAVRLAIFGNTMDLGAKNGIGLADILSELQSAPTQPILGDMESFRKAVTKAQNIFYLADNAGEIFFDRLLIEQLSASKVTLAVRGAPVINDATREDAHAAGLQDIVEIIDNGSDAPGTILEDCSPEFQQRFATADLIISKGQGNFETLNDVAHNMFFLFKTKCPVISDHTGFPVGTYVAARQGAPYLNYGDKQ